MERVEQKDPKVGKIGEDGSEPVIGARDLAAPRPSTPLVAAPLRLPNLPDLFVVLPVALRAAPSQFPGIEALGPAPCARAPGSLRGVLASWRSLIARDGSAAALVKSRAPGTSRSSVNVAPRPLAHSPELTEEPQPGSFACVKGQLRGGAANLRNARLRASPLRLGRAT